MRVLNGLFAAITLFACVSGVSDTHAASKRDALPNITTIAAATGLANAPLGWGQLCASNPDDCEVAILQPKSLVLDRASWATLNRINRFVNESIEQVEDLEHFGVVEMWTYPTDGKGDCEDIQLLKRRLLIESGVPRQALMMTVVRDHMGAGHAVLTVRTDRGDFVLDNKVNKILDWRATGYAFVKRQSQENPNVWVAIGEPGAPVVITAGAN